MRTELLDPALRFGNHLVYRACVRVCATSQPAQPAGKEMEERAALFSPLAVTRPYIIERRRTLFGCVNFSAGHGRAADTPSPQAGG